MTEQEAEALAIRIEREVGADIVDPALIPQGDGTYTVWVHGWSEFDSIEEWESFKHWTPEGY